MADAPTKKVAEKATETKTEPVAAGRAAESGDPAVHQLLARRQVATLNDDIGQLAEVDAELVKLGFTEYQH